MTAKREAIALLLPAALAYLRQQASSSTAGKEDPVAALLRDSLLAYLTSGTQGEL